MSLKILGGVARGFSLATPKSNNTRPTSVLLKRRLFDSIQDFTHHTFIDLCAGTGSMGLEALSRGASLVEFIESDKKAYQLILSNLKGMKQKYNGEYGTAKTYQLTFEKWFIKNDSIGSTQNKIYLFFDPPYEKQSLYEKFFQLISERNMTNTVVIVEACQQKTMSLDEFSRKFGTPSKIVKQGTSFFAFYDYT